MMKSAYRYGMLYLALSSLLISCKSYHNKERTTDEETQIEWQHLRQRQRRYAFRQDTSSHLWYFWTDSAFRFHPDSGLFAQAGSLFVQGTTGSSRKQMQDLTQAHEQGKQIMTQQESSISKKRSAPYLWLVGLAIFLLIGWQWSRSPRR